MFDYDGVYDDIQAQRVQPKKEEKLARKSRYIEGLLDKAKEREREQDIVYERKCAAPTHGRTQTQAAQECCQVAEASFIDFTLLLRRLAKEREAEDHLFGDKDKFLTAAYKRKLQEDQKWLAEERLREAAEKRDSVVSRGHMGDFYRCAQPVLFCVRSRAVHRAQATPWQDAAKQADSRKQFGLHAFFHLPVMSRSSRLP